MLLVECVAFALLLLRQRLLLILLQPLELSGRYSRRGLLELCLVPKIEIGRFLRLPVDQLLPLLLPRLLCIEPARRWA